MHSIYASRIYINLSDHIELAAGKAYKDLITYHLLSSLDQDFKSKDAYGILIHHVFLHLSTLIININQAGKKVVLLVGSYHNLSSAKGRVSRLVTRLLPVHCIYTSHSESHFFKALTDNDVEVVTLAEEVERKIEKNEFKHFNLNKFIKYLEKRGMKYLSSNYFQQVNSKLLAVNK